MGSTQSGTPKLYKIQVIKKHLLGTQIWLWKTTLQAKSRRNAQVGLTHIKYRATKRLIVIKKYSYLQALFVEVSNEITQFGNAYVVSGWEFNDVRNLKVDKTHTWGLYDPHRHRMQWINWKRR